jgi:hypothetical protein
MELASRIIILFGSTVFLVLSVWDYQWANKESELPDGSRGRRALDDDDFVMHNNGGYAADDDDIFSVGASGISKYLFWASMCMLVCGFLDMVEDRAAFHALLILAGAFGVASTIRVENDNVLCNTLDFVSVHFYLVDGIAMIRHSPKDKKCYRRVIMSADAQFVLGSFLDVAVRFAVLFIWILLLTVLP